MIVIEKEANNTAKALNKIVEGVAKAVNLVGDIAVASNEQVLGISQINQGIMQVSQVAQTNSATSEESAAASEELLNQAEVLKEMVGRFNLKKKSYSYYNNNEPLNEDVLNLIEKVLIKNRSNSIGETISTRSKKIALSDTEFDKY